MAAASEYARVDAWDVADSVYGDLLSSKLAIRRPERLKFARGLCQLGRVIPDHARQVLSALTEGGLRGSGGPAGPGMLAGGATMMPGGGVMGGVGGGQPSPPTEAPARAPASQPTAAPPPPPSRTAGGQAAANADAQRDSQLLAMIRQQESNRAAQVAQLRSDLPVYHTAVAQGQRGQQQEQGQQMVQQARQVPVAPVLSEAELKRQEAALGAAYETFRGILKDYPQTPTAPQARGEILLMVGHWRTLSQWERSAALALRFLTDNPTDPELPKLRLEIARDRLAWASKPIERKAGKQAMLTEVAQRFEAARAELVKVVDDFPNERNYQQEAQWDIANSFLAQARVVDAFSPTLARGQYVRAS
jgi:outer membrane protein assembly factor BamD (BamD/ComL family)